MFRCFLLALTRLDWEDAAHKLPIKCKFISGVPTNKKAEG